MSDQPSASGGLQRKQLFIEHIAARLEAMESGRTRLKAVAYRVHAKMLREALMAFPRGRLDRLLGSPHAALREAVFDRLFDASGVLHEAGAAAAQAAKQEADRFFLRLRV